MPFRLVISGPDLPHKLKTALVAACRAASVAGATIEVDGFTIPAPKPATIWLPKALFRTAAWELGYSEADGARVYTVLASQVRLNDQGEIDATWLFGFIDAHSDRQLLAIKPESGRGLTAKHVELLRKFAATDLKAKLG